MNSVHEVWRLAVALLIGLTIAAFVAAFAMQNSGLLSLTPPATWDNLNPLPDVSEGDALALYQSAFTAWVALVLLVPVFGLVWLAGRSERDYTIWLSFWTVSYVAYLIHLVVSMFLFFGGDFEAMQNTSRVSAFWPGMAIVGLWAIDIWMGFKRASGLGVTIFRVGVHVLVFALFFGGSTITGELNTVKMLGFGLLAAAVTGMTVWLKIRTQGAPE